MPFLSFRRRAVLLLSIAALFQTGTAAAFGLMQAFDAALQNDPVYRAAIHENAAGQQFKALGRSHLLPTMSFVYTQNQNAQDLTRTLTGESTFRQFPSETEVLQFRQPLFNLDAFARYKQGIAQTSQSEAKFSERSQDLIVRIVGAYADAKHAEDQLALAVAQLNVYADQRQMNDRMFAKGEGTKTDERYNGEGWGLLQVLSAMTGHGPGATSEFARSAATVLERRVKNSPPARGEARWLAGWKSRVRSYAE